MNNKSFNVNEAPVRIGLLHSLTGTMSNSEMPLLDAEMLAINEINNEGGILGRKIEPVVADGKSSSDYFVKSAKELLESNVNCLFGCWTSASRKAVRPIIEKFNSQLFYPVQYEGLEESKNICYTGSCLNQQILPAVEWAVQQYGKRIFLIGSDYVFPRTANYLIKSFVEQLQGEIVYECYQPLGSQNLEFEIEKIKSLKPSFVINTLNGESNYGFYHLCNKVGINPSITPIISTSISEPEMQYISKDGVGHFACWSYFQSLDNQDNKIFINKFQSAYGKDRVISDPMVMAYCQIYLWKMAVEKAGTFDIDSMREQLNGCSMQSPFGEITIQHNLHLSKPIRIGKIMPDGQFEIVWNHNDPIFPLPWLGVENINFPGRGMVQESLRAFTENINYNILLEKEISERKKVEKIAEAQAVRLVKEVLDKKRVNQMINFQNTVIELACSETEIPFEKKLKKIIEMSANALEVERVSIWFFDKERISISSEYIFLNTTKKYIPGFSFKSSDYPIYFNELVNTKIIVANFAVDDPRTKEFSTNYLKPLGINSMMDVPIKSNEETIGILCFEHIGPNRIWGSEEQTFASSIARIISMQYHIENSNKN